MNMKIVNRLTPSRLENLKFLLAEVIRGQEGDIFGFMKLSYNRSSRADGLIDGSCRGTCDLVDTVHYPQEFLNSLSSSGVPPQGHMLKVGIAIMLLRNLSPPTCVMVQNRENIIVATILTGPAVHELAYIPRIPMIPTDLPIPFKGYSISSRSLLPPTFNMSQGQTFSRVGIDMKKQCFSYGLYLRLGTVHPHTDPLPFGSVDVWNRRRNVLSKMAPELYWCVNHETDLIRDTSRAHASASTALAGPPGTGGRLYTARSNKSASSGNKARANDSRRERTLNRCSE
ncbi:hypothetical protein EVAR_16374_1 [Eumeta japonica]|uniref:DNA helicase Pif1-like 2B domain-containing protein n=1 Tax=Eumeta variegata TaxID=151549 RepID=A0A4C1VT45_EUMVA|nr:hypothetical protein EVAR_16374_1 [Eumeta japonica]